MNNHKDKEISKFAYLLIKEAGICVRCMAAWVVPSKVLCKDCRSYWKMYNRDEHTLHIARKKKQVV